MRFQTITAAVVIVAGSLASVVAAPHEIVRRDTSAGQALAIVNAVNDHVTTVAASVNKAINGVTWSSPDNVKAAAAQQVIQQLGTLSSTLTQASDNVSQQQTAPLKRAAADDTGDTTALINAIGALITNIDNLIIGVFMALNLTGLVGPATAVLGTLSTLVLGIAAVVVDVLPFLGNIGQLLSGVGFILSGVGSLIPK